MNFKTRSHLVLGLTGGILCGKSTALNAFKKCGAFTLSCDELVREISARPAVQKKITTLSGTHNKQETADKVFSSPSARKKLEALLHPLVACEIKKRLKENKTFLCIVEVPLLFEVSWQDAFDMTLCILANPQVLARRAKARRMSQTDFLRRSRSQFSQTKKAALADICLLNDTSAEELEDKIRAVCGALRKIYQFK